ncbi:MAG: LON peptidase substrate-binding domain-containing protein [Deltaproteobacteria bacterium]
MKSDPEFAADLTGFTGVVPIFPLPNVVLFPYIALPLHIFEDRYLRMIEGALDGERLIAVALLKPGWETATSPAPAIHETVCLGRITAEERLPTGRVNIVVTGVQRAVVVSEAETDLPYRLGKLELCSDFYAAEPAVSREVRYQELLLSFRRLFPRTRADSLFSQVLEADLPLGVTCDLLAAALRIGVADKQSLLDEVDVDLRSDLLLDKIHGLLSETDRDRLVRKFPPTFSRN